MKASETALVTFLQGPKQYVIPIYQRTYSWKEKQCEQLWEDIIRVIKNEDIPGHFLGSIVYIQKGLYQSSAVNPLLVIDGQQRLTTFTLLFAALAKAIDAQGEQRELTKNKINNYYLFNNDEEGEKRYKLILTKSDKETLLNLLEDTPFTEKASPNIVNNFKYFQEQIEKSKIDLDLLYKGICKIIIVDISLNSDYDNPQLIFESLNSTGLELSQADLIRNFVLMGLEIKLQEEIYNNFWYPMERDFGHAEGTEYFDAFMRDYLTIKLNEIPKEREVYTKFKEFFTTQQKPISEIVEDIYYYSKFFTQFSFEKSEDAEINQRIKDINALQVNVVYPFLLEVFADHHKGIITKNEFLEILEMMESYVFRRQICEIPTNSLNKTFATLYSLIKKENYLESLKAALNLKDSYRRFPNDIEFHEQFQIKNVYSFKKKTHLFRKLENFERKEPVNIDEYTIEHIMPQNEKVPQVWKEELGENWKEIHDKYLHRVGNLTLSGYNPELSDKSFQEKRDMEGGFKDSPIRLSSSIGGLEHWNQKEIEKRSKELANLGLKIWKYVSLPEEVLSKYRVVEEEDEDDDEDERAPQWNELREIATPELVRLQDKLIEAMNEKFELYMEPWKKYMVFYISKPSKSRNMFALMNCGKGSARIMFRIDPETFSDENAKIRVVNGWFFPRGKERRMRVLEEDIPLILENLDHAYQTTVKHAQETKVRQVEAAKKAWVTMRKKEKA